MPASQAAPGAAAGAQPGLGKWAPAQADGQSVAERGEAVKRALGGAMLVLCCGGAYALLRLLQLLWPMRFAIAVCLAAGEVAFFFLWYRRRYSQLNLQPERHAPDHVDSMRLFHRFVSLCHSLPDGVDIETYLTAWFRCGGAAAHMGPHGAACTPTGPAPAAVRRRGKRMRSVTRRRCAAASPVAAHAPPLLAAAQTCQGRQGR